MTSAILDPTLLMRAAVRNAAVALLLQYVPQAGGRIFRGRIWPITSTMLPALLVYAWDEDKQNVATAGGAPDFNVSLTLRVDARAEAATAEALEDLLDTLVTGMQNALLLNPDWVACFALIERCATNYQLLPGGDRPAGEAQIALTLRWQELYAEGLLERLSLLAARFTTADGTVLAGADIQP